MTLAFRWFESNYPSQKKARSKERAFFNDVCLRQMMTTTPNDVRYANDVCLAAHFMANIASLRPTGAISLWRSHNITAATPQHHFFRKSKAVYRFEPLQPSEAFPKSLPFKIYLQSHRCNGILDRFGLTKAFLREEGGTRSVTEGACATLKSDETLLQCILPQSPAAPAPSRREPLRESLPKYLKCLQNCGIINPRKAVNL